MNILKPTLSIVIPTLNEEEFLPDTLNSIKNQSFTDFEVIVADAGSKDKTVEVAKSFGCKVADGGRPARGRNCGAKVARGKYLLFLDSDVVLERNFLKNALAEFNRKNLGIASCYMIPLSTRIIDKVFHSVANFFLYINQFFNPHAPGFCILAKKEIHDRIDGFDETVRLAEDHDYVRRARKIGKFRMIRSAKISVSVRRFDTDGRFNIMWKYIYCELYLLFKGNFRKDIYEYKFGHYKKDTKSAEVKD